LPSQEGLGEVCQWGDGDQTGKVNFSEMGGGGKELLSRYVGRPTEVP